MNIGVIFYNEMKIKGVLLQVKRKKSTIQRFESKSQYTLEMLIKT